MKRGDEISTADVRLDSKCASDWKGAVNMGKIWGPGGGGGGGGSLFDIETTSQKFGL